MKIILKIFLIAILFSENSLAQQVVNEVNSIFECESLTGISGLKTGVNRFEGRDGANLKSGAFIPTCSTKSVVLKANPFLIPLITTPSGATGSPSNDYYSTSDGTSDTYDLVSKAASNPLVGMIPGTASVSPTGASSYQIPIDLPSGPNGITPQLSISYNSQNGNGLAGWCWDLSGLSIVSRIPDNYYYDGKFGHIQLDNTDHLALDGKRLLYDALTSSYHTEIDPYNTIKVTADLNTPAKIAQSITVTGKSGTRNIYGLNNSQVNLANPPANKDVPIAWLMSNTIDKNGNSINYTYSKSGADTYLQQIDYASNGNTNSAYKVIFKYTEGPDDNKYYVIGSSYIEKKLLLKSILIESNGNFLKEYTLDYAYDGQISKLIKVSLTQGSSKLNETIVSWQGSLATIIPAPISNTFPDVKSISTGDLNGDGIQDMIVLHGNHQNGNLQANDSYFVPSDMKVLIGKLDGTYILACSTSVNVDDPALTSPYSRRNVIKAWIIDTDNDGVGEIITHEIWQRIFSDGTFSGDDRTRFHQKKLIVSGTNFSLQSTEIWNGDNGFIEADTRTKQVLVGDFDGDTKTDLIFTKIAWDGDVSQTCNSYHNLGEMCDNDYFAPYFQYSNSSEINSANLTFPKDKALIPFDFNGDGKTEILALNITNFTLQDQYILTSAILGFDNATNNFTTIVASDVPAINGNYAVYPTFGDFNGDGLTDVLGYYLYPRIISTTDGRGHPIKVTVYDRVEPRIYINTIGGFALNTSLSTNIKTFLPTGLQSNNHPVLEDLKIYSGDFNADGKTDILYISGISGSTTQQSVTIAISNGTSFKTFSQIIDIGAFDTRECTVNDLNDDGRADIFIVDNSGKSGVWYINKTDENNDRLVKSITNGFGQKTSFTYNQPLPGTSFYTPSASTAPAGLIKLTPNRVVTQLGQPDGIDGITNYNYAYVGGLFHRQGKGFLGFETITQSSPQLVTQSISHYGFHGLSYTPYLSAMTLIKDNITISSSINTNVFYPKGTHWYFQYASPITTIDEINHVTTTKTFGYDFVQGNLLSISTSTSNGTSGGTETVSYTYGSYGTSAIQMPKTETVTKTVIGGTGTNSRTTSFDAYDNNARPTTIVTDKGTVKEITFTYGYNKFGSLTTKTSVYKDKYSSPANQNITSAITYTYSADGRFLTQKANNSLVTKYDYDPIYGTLISVTDPGNLVTTYNSYDDLYRLLLATDPLGNITQYTYSWDINSTNHSLYSIKKDATDLPTVITVYDEIGREIAASSDEWNKTLYSSQSFDAKRQLSDSYLPHYSTDIASNFYQSYTYKTDGTGRIDVFNDRGLTHGYTYSALSTTYNDPAQRSATQIVSAEGLPLSSTDISGGTVNYSNYDNSGQPKTITPLASDYQVTMAYDMFGRKTSYSDKSSGTTLYDYNPLDFSNYQKDADGHEYSINYDAYGRIVKKTFTGGTSIIYTYYTSGAAKGSVASIKTSDTKNQQISYGYDAFGRLNKTTREIEPAGTGKKYTLVDAVQYDNNGNVTQRTFASGLMLTYEYTKGTLTKIKKDGNDLWQLVDENAYGNAIEMKYGNDVHTYFKYSDKYQLQKEQKVSLPGTNGTYYYRTLFDSSTGNLNYRTNFEQLPKLKYDIFSYQNDRLTSAQYANNSYTQTVTYKSDNTGNIESKSDVGTYVYKTSTSKPYQLDDITSNNVELPGTTQTLSYSAFNKVTSIADVDQTASFTYDPNEERIAMKDGNNTILYGDNYEAMVDGNGNIIKEWTYITGPDGLLAVYVNDNGNKTLYYAFSDHLGSVQLLTNEDGTVAEQYNFDAWGRRRDPQTLNNLTGTYNGILRRGFTGHEHLEAHGLINMNGRLYDPVAGRMIQADPVVADATDTQTYNGYSYVYNNPLKFTDPDGDCPPCFIIALGIVVNLFINANAISSSFAYEGVGQGVADVFSYGLTGYGTDQLGTAFTTGDALTVSLATINVVLLVIPGAGEARPAIEVAGKAIVEGAEKTAAIAVEKTAAEAGLISVEKAGVKTGEIVIEKAPGFTDDVIKQIAEENLQQQASKTLLPDAVTAAKSEVIKGTNVVYQGLDAAGKVRYVGITSRDAALRFSEHLNSLGTGKEFLDFRVIEGAKGLSRSQARVIEQTLIIRYGLQKEGGALLNKINSIAPNKWLKFGIEFR